MKNDANVITIDVAGGLVRKSLARQVYEALERAIINGELPPGTRLGEDAIAAAFSVSRSPAREAIAELERISLAERLPNRDRRVAVPTHVFISDVFDVWTLIESERLYEASRSADSAAHARIDALLEEAERFSSGRDADRLRAALRDFHRALQEGCRNRQLHRIADDWYKYVLWFRNLYFDYHTQATDAALNDHRQIVECFKRGDREGLMTVMRRHIESHRDRVLAAWRKSDAAELAASTRTLEFKLRAAPKEGA